MIEEGDEDAQNNKEDPKWCIDHIQILKTKTNRMTNEEHQMKNDVEVDYGHNSVAPRPRFVFFLLLLTSFSQNLSMLNLRTLYSTSLMPTYSKKRHLVDLQLAQASFCLVHKKLAHPGELQLAQASWFLQP